MGITSATQLQRGNDHTCALSPVARSNAGATTQTASSATARRARSTNDDELDPSSTPVSVAHHECHGRSAPATATPARSSPAARSSAGAQHIGRARQRHDDGQLDPGLGLGASRLPPQVNAGGVHTCALLSDHTVECWGATGTASSATARRRQLDSRSRSAASRPPPRSSAGYGHTCALISDGTVKCWGDNNDGQLGDGQLGYSSTPVGVSAFPETGVGTTSVSPAQKDVLDGYKEDPTASCG